MKRGRPVGTGIDDAARLAQLSAYLSVHPETAVTTALRALGVEDSSAMRRLRDKYNRNLKKIGSVRTNRGDAETAMPRPVVEPMMRSAAIAAAAEGMREPRIAEPEKTAAPPAAPPPVNDNVRSNPKTPQPSDAVVALLTPGIQAFALALDLQQTFLRMFSSHPAFSAFLHQQRAMTEMALQLLKPLSGAGPPRR